MEFLLIAEGFTPDHIASDLVVARYAQAKECNHALLANMEARPDKDWACQAVDKNGDPVDVRVNTDPKTIYGWGRRDTSGYWVKVPYPSAN